MLKKVKAVFFDLDGVIISRKNAEGKHYWEETIEEDLKINLESMMEFLFTPSSKNMWTEILRGEKDIKKLFNNWLKNNSYNINAKKLLTYLAEKIVFDNRILDKANLLKQQGLTTFLATHQEPFRADYLWNKKNLKEHFEDIFIPKKVGGYLKHEPEFFNTIENQLNYKPEEMLLIDDRLRNIETAKNTGWQAYHYTDFDKAKRELFEKLKIKIISHYE